MGLLEGDTALITGAASGIGRGIAKALIAEGVRSLHTPVGDDSSARLRRLPEGVFKSARQIAPPVGRASSPGCPAFALAVSVSSPSSSSCRSWRV
jgi:NAD(P)-dependent dehydrogenase (short-subunit alcohol dehydrogenase family)